MPTTADGRTVTARERMQGLIALAVRAEELGLDAFAVGEHHSPEFVVSSPAVLLAWAAVCLPIAWGVYETLAKAAVLLK